MPKVKAVMDTKGNGTLPAQEQPKQVQLTPENSPMYIAKFIEMLVLEMRRLNANLEKMNG